MAFQPQPVIVSLSDLQAGEQSYYFGEYFDVNATAESVDLSILERAFGPSSLGILIVKDLPASFQPLRTKLLLYASRLAKLPSEELGKSSNLPLNLCLFETYYR